MSGTLSNYAPKSALWAAVVGTLIHAALLLVLLSWVFGMIPKYTRTVELMQLKLPEMTEKGLAVGQWMVQHPEVTFSSLIIFLVIDFVLLYYLASPSSYRILREIWAGLVTIFVVLLFWWISIVFMTPLQVVLEKIITKPPMR